MRPEKVKLTCKNCGHEWLEPTTSLLAAQVVVYKSIDEPTVQRRFRCPNCDKGVVADVPKEWLEP